MLDGMLLHGMKLKNNQKTPACLLKVGGSFLVINILLFLVINVHQN